ncbi:MAG: pilus assembly PilX N-terminal domain-containing protein [Gammaproteobacteria bacterium]|nr:pilus assembly PilX N-terminal domain-containing protein [Gammaproteobacteria bacterium]
MMYANKFTKQKNQHGVALVISLLFLLVLTLIGISSAKTSILQERIAGQSGLQQSAFQAADSCTNRILKDKDIFTFNRTLSDLFSGSEQYMVSNSINNRAGYRVRERFTGRSIPPRGTGYSATKFQVAHNEHRCQGLTESSSANITIHQGIFQVYPKI